MTSNRFFVYGSLTEGMVHFDKVKNFIESSQDAWIHGIACRLPIGFPVVLEGPKDLGSENHNEFSKIHGQLVELKAPDMLFALLDEFHGFMSYDLKKSLYHRKPTKVFTQESETDALVYYMNPEKLPKGSIRIQNGDWKKSLQENPTLISKLTERQITYLKKLSKASGRDVVPINDLSLYRELMGMELIVDKGRRLALSKLGKEVCNYI